MLSRRKSQKPDHKLISHFQTMFADLVSKQNGLNPTQDVRDSMYRTVADEVDLSAHLKMKSHDQSLNTEFISWVLRDSDPSFSCLNPNALSLTSGLEQQISNQPGPREVGYGDFEPLDPYPCQIPSNGPYPQQAAYAPSRPSNRDSGYETADDSKDLSINNFSTQAGSKYYPIASSEIHDSMTMPSDEKFRYNVSLMAPTAMFNSAKEDPVTYLNKGQQYSLVIKDTNPPSGCSDSVRYRTYVRVSFEEKEQRSNPAAYWQLWNDGRAINEAPHWGRKLSAVEYMNTPRHSGAGPEQQQTQLERASFDGFCVTWVGSPNTGTSDCVVGVRFNFLSTDFSHSKGVKGAPVRLCVKTEILPPNEGIDHEPEVCFCRVKLFRDHGAERKLSNDVVHLNKTIEKLQKQVLQAEIGGGVTLGKQGNRPMKVTKHPRKHSRHGSWSSERQLQDDIRAEIETLQRMFSSARPISTLGLLGDEHDDPDLHPVQLEVNPSHANQPADPRCWNIESIPEASSCPQRKDSMASALADMQIAPDDSKQSNCPAVARQMRKVENPQTVTDGMQVVDVDATYRPPESTPKPVACFYVRFISNGEHVYDYYHAIYLKERTVRELIEKISAKRKIDPERVTGAFHMDKNGLRIMVDDDVVRELPEGQDMVVDISKALSYGNVGGIDSYAREPLEVKLMY